MRLFFVDGRAFLLADGHFSVRFAGDSAPDSAHRPLSGGQGLITRPDASVVPLRPPGHSPAFWYAALGREMPLRWP